jgi:hypothetical protein
MPARRERGQRRRQIGESSVFTQHPCGLRRAQHEPGVCRGDERDRVEAPYRGDEAVGFDEDGDDGRRNEGQRPSVSSSIRSGEAVNGRPPEPDRCGPRPPLNGPAILLRLHAAGSAGIRNTRKALAECGRPGRAPGR